jgi:Ca-activated chloride channel family protein
MKYLIFVSTIFVALLAGCGNQSSQNDNVNPDNLYALRGVDNSWPPMGESNNVVSKNLVAQNFYLIVDGSGSMASIECSNNRPKMEVAKIALKEFVNKIPTDANIGMLTFDNTGIRETQQLGLNNSNAIKSSIQGLRTGRGTPLRTAIDHGYAALTAQAKQQLGYGEYHLVVVTDGSADIDQSPGTIVSTVLSDSPVNIHTIGFCLNQSHALNIPGKTLYKAADNPEALAEGLESVLAEAPDFNVDSFGG